MTSLYVAGSPEQCRGAADGLREAQRAFARCAQKLGDVADHATTVWQGIAAEGFQQGLRERRLRAESLGLVARELAAGLDALAQGLETATGDMRRARAIAEGAGIRIVDDHLPPLVFALATAPDPEAAGVAHERASGLAAMGRAAETSAQNSWWATLSGALRELGVTLVPPREPDDAEDSGGILDGLIPDLPDLPDLPDVPWDQIDEGLLGALNVADDVSPWFGVPREGVEQWVEDQHRSDLDVWQRLGRAGVVGGSALAGGVVATAACRRFAPESTPLCTIKGIEGGSFIGNAIVDGRDAR